MNKDIWIELNLNYLDFNIKQIQKHTNNKKIIAVVKSNGYGHGVLNIIPTLLNNNINNVAVANLDEAVEIREKFGLISILILGFTSLDISNYLWDYNLEQTIFDYDYAVELSCIAQKNNKIINVHIKIDTGMGRLGFTLKDIELIKKIYKMNNLCVVGIYSHFSSSCKFDKSFSYEQFNNFSIIIKKLEDSGIQNIGYKHFANSGAVLDLKETYMDCIRPGKLLYGYLPSEEVHNKLFLKPILSLKCKIIQLKNLEEGSNVGYGNIYKTKRKSVIAVLPLGYSDGYNRMLSYKVFAFVKNKVIPILSICMNLSMADVTDIENINLNDIVTIYGEIENVKETKIETISKILGTNNYEVLCNINKKIPRICI